MADIVQTARRVVRLVGSFVVRAPRYVLVGIFRVWQLLVSPTYGQTCRFYPSCSAYGVEAVTTHGAVKGLALTLWRILRCNPWNAGGVDPVPSRGGAPADHSSPHHGLSVGNDLTEATDPAAQSLHAASLGRPDETASPTRRAA